MILYDFLGFRLPIWWWHGWRRQTSQEGRRCCTSSQVCSYLNWFEFEHFSFVPSFVFSCSMFEILDVKVALSFYWKPWCSKRSALGLSNGSSGSRFSTSRGSLVWGTVQCSNLFDSCLWQWDAGRRCITLTNNLFSSLLLSFLSSACLSVSLEDLYNGRESKLHLTKDVICAKCKG